MRRSHLVRVLSLLLVTALVATSCSSDESPPAREGASSAAEAGAIQDIWVLARVRAVGAENTLVDLTEQLVEPLAASADDPVELAEGVTFRATPELGARLVDGRGQTRPEVVMDVGLLDYDGELGLVVLATPDLTRGGQVAFDDEIILDLSLVDDDLVDGGALITDYVFAQTMPSDDDAVNADEAALGSLELLSARLGRNALQYTSLDEDGEPLAIAGQVGEVVVSSTRSGSASGGPSSSGGASGTGGDGSSGADEGAAADGPQVVLVQSGGGSGGSVPAKARPMVDGLGKGFVSCAKGFGSLTCVRKFFQKFGKGVSDSWANIKDQLEPDPPPPPKKCILGCGGSSGEPHLRTFDGTRYDLQTAGEIVAARTEGFELQLRTEPYSTSLNVSVNTAAAVSVGEQRVTVTSGEETEVRIDGELVELDALRADPMALDGATVEVRTDVLVVATETGIVVDVHNLGGTRLDVYVDPGEETTDWEGPFGDLDGDDTNDLVPQGGTAPIDPEDRDALYGEFAESWRVTDETSLFDYDDGESTDTFTDRDFPAAPATVDSLDPIQRGIAQLVCAAAQISDQVTFDECVLDYALTGDISFVRGAQLGDAVQQVVDGDLVPGDLASAIIELGLDTDAVVDARALEWAWQVDDRDQLEDRGGEIATGEGIAVVRTRDTDDVTYLTAIDLDSGVERWEVPDVEVDCRPVVTSAGVVAHLERGTESAGDDPNDDLVLLDLDTGEITSRWQPDGDDARLSRCESALTALDDGTAISVDRDDVVRAFATDGGLALAWEIEVPRATLGSAPVVDGAPHLLVRNEAETALSVWRLDPATGETVAALEVPGVQAFPAGDIDALTPLDDERLAVIAVPTADTSDSVVVIRTGSELSVEWIREFGDDEELRYRPDQVVVADGQIAFWSDLDGRVIVALDLDSGDLGWTAEPSSFDNTAGQISGVGGLGFLISPFGGAWLEALADGEQLWAIDDVPGLESPQTHTPVDGGLLVSGRIPRQAANGAYVGLVALDR